MPRRRRGHHTDSVRASASTSYGHGLGSAHPSRRREASSPRYQRSKVIGSRFVTSLRSSCISTRTDPMSVGTDTLVGPDTAGAAPNASPERRTAASAAAPDRQLRGRPVGRVSPRPSAVDAELQCPVCGSDVKVANRLPHFDRSALGPSSRGSGARSASANSCAAGLRGTCCKPFRTNAANKPGGEITDGASRSDESGRAHGGLAPPTSQTMLRATSARTCCQRSVHRQGHRQFRDDLLARPEGARGVR
jgi:hypothetical protein